MKTKTKAIICSDTPDFQDSIALIPGRSSEGKKEITYMLAVSKLFEIDMHSCRVRKVVLEITPAAVQALAVVLNERVAELRAGGFLEEEVPDE